MKTFVKNPCLGWLFESTQNPSSRSIFRGHTRAWYLPLNTSGHPRGNFLPNMCICNCHNFFMAFAPLHFCPNLYYHDKSYCYTFYSSKFVRPETYVPYDASNFASAVLCHMRPTLRSGGMWMCNITVCSCSIPLPLIYQSIEFPLDWHLIPYKMYNTKKNRNWKWIHQMNCLNNLLQK